MRLRKMTACFCALLVVALVGFAQDDKNKNVEKPKPDLNGTWVLDKSKSDFGPFSQSTLARADTTLTVMLKDPEFRLTRNLKVEGKEQHGDWVYYTDGRGESNPSIMAAGDLKSKTKWDGSKIVSKASVTRQMQGAEVKVEITEKWELSKDGKNLIDTLTINSPNGTREVKQVYSRTP